MKKIFTLILGITIAYSCSSSSESDNNNDNNTTSVTDIDGNVYQTVTICDQTWTQSNLNVSKYRNGDNIPQVTDPTTWANLTIGAWCYYDNDSTNGTVYGKLYNWYALNDPRGLAPTGYHIPSDNEWTILTTCLEGTGDVSGAMKETGTSHWLDPNIGATNSSGFTALPGGYRSSNGDDFGIFGSGVWWSCSQVTESNYIYGLIYPLWSNHSGDVNNLSRSKLSGCSVRCVKD